MPSGRLGPWRLVLGLLVVAAGLLAAGPAHARVVWLCHPEQARNPCTVSLETIVLAPSGKVLGVRRAQPRRRSRADCFYLYPTVSEQPTALSNLHVDPEQRAIARLQAARYSQRCRVFAPMYRQQTLFGLSKGNAPPRQVEIAYRSVLRAWRAYRRENPRRRFVLVGHSQGSELLRRLVAEQIDGRRRVRRLMLSAQLLGGNVAVADGRGVDGDFKHVPACRRPAQRHCVVAYSAFNEPVPADALYGRVNGPFNPGDPDALDVLCTNPASLGGGRSVKLRSLFPVGDPTLPGLGGPTPRVATPWFELRGWYSGACVNTGGASVLRITGAPVLTPFPDATWGLHLVELNLGLGDLVDLVRTELRRR